MKKWLKISLMLLVFFYFAFNLHQIANANIDPKELLKAVNKSICKAFVDVRGSGSIGKRSVKGIFRELNKVEGILTLIAPFNELSLTEKEIDIYKGNSQSVKEKKIIDFVGTFFSGMVDLMGTGSVGDGYSFSFNFPDARNGFCIPISRKVRGSVCSSIFHLSFMDNSIKADDYGGGCPKLTKIKNKATLRGNIDTGKGFGRFKLKFTE